MENGDMF